MSANLILVRQKYRAGVTCAVTTGDQPGPDKRQTVASDKDNKVLGLGTVWPGDLNIKPGKLEYFRKTRVMLQKF